jgi:hypothetical protein
MKNDRTQASETQCTQLLRALLDRPEQLMTALAPEGWYDSPLRRVFHPTAQQQYEECIESFDEIFERIYGRKRKKRTLPEPRLDEFTEDPPNAGNPNDEFIKLLGECLWSVFSCHHTIYDGRGRDYHLGSFRWYEGGRPTIGGTDDHLNPLQGSAGFIADFLNEYHPSSKGKYDFLDFYCVGSNFERADVTPVFQAIFERLKARGCDWEYTFPRIALLDFSNMQEDEQDDDPSTYYPGKAMEQKMEYAAKEKEKEQIMERLDIINEEEYEDAKYKKPPPIAQAYRNVYGQLPFGYPEPQGTSLHLAHSPWCRPGTAGPVTANLVSIQNHCSY